MRLCTWSVPFCVARNIPGTELAAQLINQPISSNLIRFFIRDRTTPCVVPTGHESRRGSYIIASANQSQTTHTTPPCHSTMPLSGSSHASREMTAWPWPVSVFRWEKPAIADDRDKCHFIAPSRVLKCRNLISAMRGTVHDSQRPHGFKKSIRPHTTLGRDLSTRL